MKRDETWIEMEAHYVVRIKGTDKYVDACDCSGGTVRWRSDVDRPMATELTRFQAYELAGGTDRLVPVKVSVWKRFWRGSVALKRKKVTT